MRCVPGIRPGYGIIGPELYIKLSRAESAIGRTGSRTAAPISVPYCDGSSIVRV